MILAVPPGVEALDLAGPLQVFDEARRLGAPFEVQLAAPQPRLRSDQGFRLSDLAPLPEPRATARLQTGRRAWLY